MSFFVKLHLLHSLARCQECERNKTECVGDDARPLTLWLCHSDARQVSDLPALTPFLSQGLGSKLAVYDRLQTILSILTFKGSSSFGQFFQMRALDQR